jgi:hypothetical protein
MHLRGLGFVRSHEPESPIKTQAAASIPEPFGFKVGMTKAQVIQLVGPQSILKDDEDVLELSTAPIPHEDFNLYSISVSPTTGIVLVMAVSKEIETSAYGEGLKGKFDSLKNALGKKYGGPADSFDFLTDGSIWSEANDWMMGLNKKERTLAAYWKAAGDVSVSLEALASSQESGFVIVQYQYPTFAAWASEYEQKQDASL